MSDFINIGFGNLVNTEKVVAVVNPDAAPIKRMVQNAKEQQHVIDATQGRRTKAVIIMETEQIVLSAVQPDTIARRMNLQAHTKRVGEVDGRSAGETGWTGTDSSAAETAADPFSGAGREI